MKLSLAAKLTHGTLKGDDVEFQFLHNDSRTLKPATLYVALRGEQFDGHDFVAAAVEAGAVAVLVDRDVDCSVPCLHVDDAQKALAELASYYRKTIDPIIIAVTGSCGKTTTKMLLTQVFTQQGNVLSNERSFNNNIGVPLTLLRLQPEHDYAICEMGANHPGEIAELVDMVKPDVAIITNVGASHLEGFGDLEGVANAKSEIYQGLDKNGIAIINQDSPYADYFRQRAGGRKVVTFAVDQTADVMAKEIQVNKQVQPSFQLVVPNGMITVNLPLLGLHNVQNAIAVAAAAYALNIPIEKIKQGLEMAVAVERRLREFVGWQGATVIDDSYNANPLSVAAALDILARRQGRSVLVLGDMKELGKHTDQFHRELGELAFKRGIDRLYCFGEHSRHAADAFGKQAVHYMNQQALIEDLKHYIDQDVTILVKGSNSMKMNIITKALVEV